MSSSWATGSPRCYLRPSRAQIPWAPICLIVPSYKLHKVRRDPSRTYHPLRCFHPSKMLIHCVQCTLPTATTTTQIDSLTSYLLTPRRTSDRATTTLIPSRSLRIRPAYLQRPRPSSLWPNCQVRPTITARTSHQAAPLILQTDRVWQPSSQPPTYRIHIPPACKVRIGAV